MALKVTELNSSDVIRLFECWDLSEFVDLVKEKDINGQKLLVSRYI